MGLPSAGRRCPRVRSCYPGGWCANNPGSWMGDAHRGDAIARGSEQQARVTWWEPGWSSRARLLAELSRSGLTRPSLWLRCIAIGGLMLAGFLMWFQRAYPGIPHGVPVRTLVLGVLAVPAMLAVQVGVMLIAPTRICIKADMVDISRGQSTLRVKPPEVIDAGIEFDELERPLLRLSYRLRGLRRSKPGRERMRVYAIGAKVDLVELDKVLGALLARRTSEGASGASSEQPPMAQMDPDQIRPDEIGEGVGAGGARLGKGRG